MKHFTMKARKCAVQLAAVVFGLLVVACTEKASEDPVAEPIPVDIDIYTQNYLSQCDRWEYVGSESLIRIFMGYDYDMWDFWNAGHYLTLEMLDGKDYLILTDYFGESRYNILSNIKGTRYYAETYYPTNWPQDAFEVDISYLAIKEFGILIPDEGEYEFVLKIYQPESKQTYVSSKYKLTAKYCRQFDNEYCPYYYIPTLEKIE